MVGSLQWSHDLSAMDTSSGRTPSNQEGPCFNGAMTSQPWIRQLRKVYCRKGGKLQWSHDLSAMDTYAD